MDTEITSKQLKNITIDKFDTIVLLELIQDNTFKMSKDLLNPFFFQERKEEGEEILCPMPLPKVSH